MHQTNEHKGEYIIRLHDLNHQFYDIGRIEIEESRENKVARLIALHNWV